MSSRRICSIALHGHCNKAFEISGTLHESSINLHVDRPTAPDRRKGFSRDKHLVPPTSGTVALLLACIPITLHMSIELDMM